jgi:hypothetical protein
MKIDSYEFGRMVVDGRAYTTDLILYPDRVDASWRRIAGHRLCLRDLDAALSVKPDILLIGTGFSGVMQVPDDVRRAIAQEGIALYVARSGEAADLFGSLPRHKKVVAAFHLTC